MKKSDNINLLIEITYDLYFKRLVLVEEIDFYEFYRNWETYSKFDSDQIAFLAENQLLMPEWNKASPQEQTSFKNVPLKDVAYIGSHGIEFFKRQIVSKVQTLQKEASHPYCYEAWLDTSFKVMVENFCDDSDLEFYDSHIITFEAEQPIEAIELQMLKILTDLEVYYKHRHNGVPKLESLYLRFTLTDPSKYMTWLTLFYDKNPGIPVPDLRIDVLRKWPY